MPGKPMQAASSHAAEMGIAYRPASDGGVRYQLRELLTRQQNVQRHLAGHLGVDSAGLATLGHLSVAGTVTPTELARRLEISTAAMTLVLNRLEAAGHITRQPHPSDRRKVLVSPVRQSVETATELVRPMIDGIARITDAMTPPERATVAKFLADMIGLYDNATRQDRPASPGWNRAPAPGWPDAPAADGRPWPTTARSDPEEPNENL